MEIQPKTYVRLAVNVAIFVVGFIGNLLTIIVICRKGQNKSAYQMLVLNLAISDFLFIISILPMATYELFGVIDKSEIYCRVIWPMFTIFYFLSIFTITSMALQRCRSILLPYRPKLSKRKTFAWITAIWFASFIIVSPLAVVTTSVYPGKCEEEWPSLNHRKAYTMALFLLQYLLPLLIITIMYAKITSYLLNSSQVTRSGGFVTEEQLAAEARRIKKRNQAIRTLAAVVILFAIFLFPGQVAWLMIDFGNGGSSQEKAIDILFAFSDVLDNFHACINPVIYCLLNTRYRKEYFRCLVNLFRGNREN
ncbi:hypothetical protein OS493_027493 [Desmophyllum pertusum]|uniref:G-protein coupled receptors family 1 profile domain-containing protein n=1 Tax=Desmophyllum pertusum TaxID=174260 RepID=A0A9W9Y9H0_9CNID|nr:hypothetical protein OS493_027493 [Desmophyllum pertusum]